MTLTANIRSRINARFITALLIVILFAIAVVIAGTLVSA